MNEKRKIPFKYDIIIVLILLVIANILGNGVYKKIFNYMQTNSASKQKIDTKQATSTEEIKDDYTSSLDMQSINDAVLAMINIRYAGNMDSVDKYYEQGIINIDTYYYIKNYFKSNSSSDDSNIYRLDDEYAECLASLQKQVESYGGTVDSNLNVVYPEGATEIVRNNDDYEYYKTTESTEYSDNGPDPDEETYVEEDNSNEHGVLANDPRCRNLYDTSGKLVWSGLTQGQVEAMTPDEINEFNRIYEAYEKDYEDHYKKIVENSIKSPEQLDMGIDADDKQSRPEFTRDTLMSLNSPFIKSQLDESNKTSYFYIDWKYIVENYNKSTGRLNYNLLGYEKYLDINKLKSRIPPYLYSDSSDYLFVLSNYSVSSISSDKIEYKGTFSCPEYPDRQINLDGVLNIKKSSNNSKYAEISINNDTVDKCITSFYN